ncbi:MAG: OsmC family peroxiredoxin [Candidatus Methanomarinus sp.]|uniref:OsmC family peroxiredoxin n=1 Tax=Candidatus Methanomarinus sp. TaxID=3386244 RepID=A0AC61SCY3_9EURY|nr:Organic hydroperoxide reductase OsmC/OhrA [ANME-2 cluster archaeon]TKY92485.1 MAG: OsmC family peroxiredoxin [ANME-2 cluster archaeon]
MEKSFRFSNTIKWKSEYEASLFFGDKANFEFATPPEFRGPEGFVSPEELFVASAHACCLTTFIAKALKAEINLISYESSAEGILEKLDGQLMFTKIAIKSRIKTDGDKEKVKKIIEQVEQNALVINSMKTNVTIDAIIE